MDGRGTLRLGQMADKKSRREELTISEREILHDLDEEYNEGEGAHFQSTFGLVLSCLGCVVGTGNIWRFPRIVANNSEQEGGLVFIIIWFMFLFLWSIPLLLVEYGTGRFTKSAVLASVRQFLGDNHIWCGAWISLISFVIGCYYSVVLGWCFYYFIYYVGHSLPDNVDEARGTFRDYAEESVWPVLTHFIAVFLAGLCVTKGVKTIEKVSMVLVPLLMLILMFTFVWSLTRENMDKGLKFLFTPHWESFGDPRTWVDAISQNAFDTGAGMGIFIPYSAYMTRKNGVVKYGHLVPASNNLVSGTLLYVAIAGFSLLCGMTIFGTVFSSLMSGAHSYTNEEIIEVLKDSGPASTGLTFIWMPVLFETVGDFGRVVAILFFLSLSFAGVTSLMSGFELATKTLQDFGVQRMFGMPLVILLTFLLGLPSALNIDVLTNQDFVWGFALVINGFLMWYMILKFGPKKFRQDVVNRYGENDWPLTITWQAVFVLILPVEAVVIIVWWAVDLIDNEAGDGENWYDFGRETLVMTLLQWLTLLSITVIANVIFVVVRNYRRSYYPEPDYGSESDRLLLPSRGVATSNDLEGDLTASRDLTGSMRELKL